MKVGEIWRYKEEGIPVRIIRIWQDEPEDHDLMVALELVDLVNYNEDDDGFADYFRDEFIVQFERVYDEV